MKKSEIAVTMPMTAFEEYERYKTECDKLKKRLSDCFDSSLLKAGASQAVNFDARKALEVCREFLPFSRETENADIEIMA